MPNRARAPRISQIKHIDLPDIDVITLDNGVPLFVVHSGTQELARLEVVFHAGRPYESKRLAARASAAQIREGSVHRTSAQVAEHFDFFGSEFSNPYHMDTVNLSIVALNKHLEQVLPVFSELLNSPAYPAAELDNFIQRNQQKLLVDLSQNDVIAYRQITEMIFGADHPYGYNSMPDTYAALTTQDLHDHFNKTCTTGNCMIFASGMVDASVVTLLNQQLGQAIRPGAPVSAHISEPNNRPEKIYIQRPKSHQTAIRIGRKLFTKHHPDYHKMAVVNTILGGYFGSRLMSSVREEKGYTYNIYSSLETMRFDGYFYIATETGNEVVQDALNQIYVEIELLQEQLVPQKELDLAKSYLMGGMLSQIDGPFNTIDLARSLTTELLPLSFFKEAMDTIREITPEEIRTLAQRYLQREEMWEILVGP